jgi:type VI protein secretion system component VasK
MATSSTIPSTPNPETTVLIGTAVRAILYIIGPALATYGVKVDQSTGELVAGAVITIVTVVWSFWQRFQQAKLDHAGNVASARGGQAVKVIAQEGVPPV